MKRIALTCFVFFTLLAETPAQPFALAINNVDGSPFTCNLLEDLGIYKRLRVQATQSSSSATWEFPQLCSFPGNVWRPYTSGTAPIPFNTVIPPIPNTPAALYNSGNGGASGNLSPVTSGRYYTFNVQNIFTPTGSPYICVLETETFPVSLQTVTQNPAGNAVGENDPVTVTINTSSAPVENVFVRYTTDNFTSTSIVQASFAGMTGTAVIPAFPFGTSVKYYVYSSPKSKAVIDAEAALYGEVVHDMSTLDWNTNISQNYSYVVTTTVPVKIEYLRGLKRTAYNELNWKVNCTNTAGTTLTLERSSEGVRFVNIYSIAADQQRCTLPFTYIDNNAYPGINYYRLRMQEMNGAVSYSAIIAILNRESGFEMVSLLPTLVDNGSVLLNVSAAKPMKMEVILSDVLGKTVQRSAYQLISGSNQFLMDVSALAAGTYYVSTYTMEGKSRVLRFVKK